MTDPKRTRIIIPRDGISTGAQQPRAVYDPMSHKVLSAMGTVSTMRASHVEVGRDLSQDALEFLANSSDPAYAAYIIDGSLGQPYKILDEYAEHWFADMTPTGQHFVLGPYAPAERDKALQEEVAWLQAHNIPTCAECTANQHASDPVDTTIRPEVDAETVYRHDADGLPICGVCHQTIRFDIDEPFAHCGCGTMEWGNTGNKYREIEERLLVQQDSGTDSCSSPQSPGSSLPSSSPS